MQHAASNHAAKLTGCVGSHGMHQDEVGGVFLQGHLGTQAASHRKRGNAAGTDERVDFAVCDGRHEFAKNLGFW